MDKKEAYDRGYVFLEVMGLNYVIFCEIELILVMRLILEGKIEIKSWRR